MTSESADALSDYFTFGSSTVNGYQTKFVSVTNPTNFNAYCAQNGGTMALPTFVLVDDVVYPVVSFSIPNNANYAGITSLTFPEGYISVSKCNGLNNCTSVTLPESLETIGESAFSHIPNLTSIKIPDKVSTLGRFAFEACTTLSSFEAKNIKVLDHNYGVGAQFRSCTSLRTVKLGGTFTSIPGYCFSNCTALEELTIPATVNSISTDSIADCSNLRTINYGGNMLQFKNISNIAVTIAASTSADITVNCSDGTLHYTDGVLDE